MLTDSGTRRWTDALVELQRKQDAIIRDTDWRTKPLPQHLRWQLAGTSRAAACIQLHAVLSVVNKNGSAWWADVGAEDGQNRPRLGLRSTTPEDCHSHRPNDSPRRPLTIYVVGDGHSSPPSPPSSPPTLLPPGFSPLVSLLFSSLLPASPLSLLSSSLLLVSHLVSR